MNTRFFLLLSASALVLFSCGNKKTFTIEGKLENGAGKRIVIEEIAPKEIIPIDTIKLDKDGHFSFTYEMPYQSFYNIKVSDQDFAMLLPDYGETIILTGDYNRLSPTYEVEGSKGSTQLWQLNDFSKFGQQRLDSISRAFDQLCIDCKRDTNCIKKQKPLLDSVYKEAFAQQQQYVVSFIERNKGSLSTLIALYKTYNTRPLINPQTDDFEFYEMIANALEEALPDNKHSQHFRNTVEHMRIGLNTQRQTTPQAVVTLGDTEK
jgi:hypothetical protein